MTHQFYVSLHGCGSCVSHSHCPTCCERTVEDLLLKPYIQTASLDPIKKLLTVTSAVDADTLADLLDDLGIFAEG